MVRVLKTQRGNDAALICGAKTTLAVECHSQHVYIIQWYSPCTNQVLYSILVYKHVHVMAFVCCSGWHTEAEVKIKMLNDGKSRQGRALVVEGICNSRCLYSASVCIIVKKK